MARVTVSEPGTARPLAPADGLPRVIGPGRFALIAVGLTIATAIFRVPSVIAAEAGSPGKVIAVWIVGAIFAFAGGLISAELAARLPRAGGEIAFLKAAYGDGAAFVFGWTWLLVVSPASIAAVARTVSDYAGTIVPLGEAARRGLTVVVIGLHALLAIWSTRLASRAISGATVAKLLAMGVVVVAAFVLPATPPASVPPLDPNAGSTGAIIAAMVAVIWAFDGSAQATLAGDVKDPDRSLPRGILLATALITLVYLLLNAAYVRTLGLAGVAGSEAVAADAMAAIGGRTGSLLVAATVILSAYSCGMAQLMSHPRVTYAMARDGMFFRRFGTLSPRTETPWVAVALHATMAAVLATLGGYGFLLRLAVFSYYPLLAAAYLGTIRLRRREGMPRGFRMPLYPIPLMIYVGLFGVVMAVSLVDDPAAPLYGSGVIIAGSLVYRFLLRRWAGPETARDSLPVVRE